MPGAAQDTLREVSDTINEVVGRWHDSDPVGAVTGMLEDKADQVLANATNFISQALPSFPAAFLGSLRLACRGMPTCCIRRVVRRRFPGRRFLPSAWLRWEPASRS